MQLKIIKLFGVKVIQHGIFETSFFASPALAERLVSIGLDPKVKGYTAVSAIQTAFSILQSGVVDRENKQELKKLRELMERMEGEPSGIIDI